MSIVYGCFATGSIHAYLDIQLHSMQVDPSLTQIGLQERRLLEVIFRKQQDSSQRPPDEVKE